MSQSMNVVLSIPSGLNASCCGLSRDFLSFILLQNHKFTMQASTVFLESVEEVSLFLAGLHNVARRTCIITSMVQTRLMPLAATIIISDPYFGPNRHAAGSSQPSSDLNIDSKSSNGLFVCTDSLPIVVENDDATSHCPNHLGGVFDIFLEKNLYR